MFSKVTTATAFARRLHEEPSLERQNSQSGSNVFPPRKRTPNLEAAFDRRKTAVRNAMSYLTDREREESGGEWDLARRKLEADRARQYLEDKEFEKLQKVQATERELERELLYEKVLMDHNRVEKEQAAAQKRERQRQQELELQKQREYLMHITNFDDTGLLWPPNMPIKMRHPSGSGSREDSIEYYSSDDSDEERSSAKHQVQCVESPPGDEPVILGHLARAMMRAEERSAEALTSRPEGLTRAWKTPETTAEIHYYGVRTLPLASVKVTSPVSGSDQLTSPEGLSTDELSSNDEGRKVKFGKKSNGQGIKRSKKGTSSDGSSTEGILKNNGKTDVAHGGARPKTRLSALNVDEAYKKKQAQNSKTHKLGSRFDHTENSPDSPVYKGEKKTDKLFGFTLGESDIERGYMHHMGLDVLNVDPDDSPNWKEKVERHERYMAMAAQNYPPSHYSDIEQETFDVQVKESTKEVYTVKPDSLPTSPPNILETPGNMDKELEDLYKKFCERQKLSFDHPLEVIETNDSRVYEDIDKPTTDKEVTEEVKCKEEKEGAESLKRIGSGRHQVLKFPKSTKEGPILVPPSVMKQAIKSHGGVGVMSTRVGIPEADEGKPEPGTVLFSPTVIPEPTIIESPLERKHSNKRRDSARSKLLSETDGRSSRRSSESASVERREGTKSKDGRDLDRRGNRGSRRPCDSEIRGSRRLSEPVQMQRQGSAKSKDGRSASQSRDLERSGSVKTKSKLTREHSGRSKPKDDQSAQRPSIPDELKGRDNPAFEKSPVRHHSAKARRKSPKSPSEMKRPDVIQCIYTEKKHSTPSAPKPASEKASKSQVDTDLSIPKIPSRPHRSTSCQRKLEKPAEHEECEANSPTSPRSRSRRDLQSEGNNMNKSAGREVTWAKEIERGREEKRLDIPQRPKRRRDESRSVERGEDRMTSSSRESRETTKRESVMGMSKSDGSIKSLMKTEPIREGIPLEKGKSVDSEKTRTVEHKQLPFPKRPTRRSRSRGGSAEDTHRIPLAPERTKKDSSQYADEKCGTDTRRPEKKTLSCEAETTWNIPTRPERRSQRADKKLKVKKSGSSDDKGLHKPTSDDEEAGLSKKIHSFESIELRITLDDDDVSQTIEKDERKENIPESNILGPSSKSSRKERSATDVKNSSKAPLETSGTSSIEHPSREVKPEVTSQPSRLQDKPPLLRSPTETSPLQTQRESSKIPEEVSPGIALSCVNPDFPERPPRKAKMKKKTVVEERNDLNEVGSRALTQTDVNIVQLSTSGRSPTKNEQFVDKRPSAKPIEDETNAFSPKTNKKVASKPPYSVISSPEKLPVTEQWHSPNCFAPASPLPSGRSPLLPIRSYSLDHSTLKAAAPKEKRSFVDHINIKEISNMIEEITNKTMDRMRHPGFTSFPGLRKEGSSDKKNKAKPQKRYKVQKQKSESDMKALAVTKSESDLDRRRIRPLAKTASQSILVQVSSPLVSPLTSTQTSPLTSPLVSPITFEPLPEPMPRRKRAEKLAKIQIHGPTIVSRSSEINSGIPPIEPSPQIEKSPIFHIQVVHPRAKISEVILPGKEESRPPQTPQRYDSLPDTTGDSLLTGGNRLGEDVEVSKTDVGGLTVTGQLNTEEDHVLIESGSLPRPKYRHPHLSPSLSLSGRLANQSPQPEASPSGKVCKSPTEVHVKIEVEKTIVTGRASPRPKYSPLLSAIRPCSGKRPKTAHVEKPMTLYVGKSVTSPVASKSQKSIEVLTIEVSQVRKPPDESTVAKSDEVVKVYKSLDSPSAPEISLNVEPGKEEIAASESSPRPVYKFSHVPSEKLAEQVVQSSSPQAEAAACESQPHFSDKSTLDELQLTVNTNLEKLLDEEQVEEHANSLTKSVGSPAGFPPTAVDSMLWSPGGTKPAVKPPYTLWGEDGWVRSSPELTDHHPHFPNHTPPIGDIWDSRRGSIKSDSTSETDRRSSLEKRSDLRSESVSEPKCETDSRKAITGEPSVDICTATHAKSEMTCEGTIEQARIFPTASGAGKNNESITDNLDDSSKNKPVILDDLGLCLLADNVLQCEIKEEPDDVMESRPCLNVKTPGLTDSSPILDDKTPTTSADEDHGPECRASPTESEPKLPTGVSLAENVSVSVSLEDSDFGTGNQVQRLQDSEIDHNIADKVNVDDASSPIMDSEQARSLESHEEGETIKEVAIIVSKYDGGDFTETIMESVYTDDKGIVCDLMPDSKDKTTECDISSQEVSPSRLTRTLNVPQPEGSDTDSLEDDVFEAPMAEDQALIADPAAMETCVAICQSNQEICSATPTLSGETSMHHKKELPEAKMDLIPLETTESSDIKERETDENSGLEATTESNDEDVNKGEEAPDQSNERSRAVNVEKITVEDNKAEEIQEIHTAESKDEDIHEQKEQKTLVTEDEKLEARRETLEDDVTDAKDNGAIAVLTTEYIQGEETALNKSDEPALQEDGESQEEDVERKEPEVEESTEANTDKIPMQMMQADLIPPETTESSDIKERETDENSGLEATTESNDEDVNKGEEAPDQSNEGSRAVNVEMISVEDNKAVEIQEIHTAESKDDDIHEQKEQKTIVTEGEKLEESREKLEDDITDAKDNGAIAVLATEYIQGKETALNKSDEPAVQDDGESQEEDVERTEPKVEESTEENTDKIPTQMTQAEVLPEHVHEVPNEAIPYEIDIKAETIIVAEQMPADYKHFAKPGEAIAKIDSENQAGETAEIESHLTVVDIALSQGKDDASSSNDEMYVGVNITPKKDVEYIAGDSYKTCVADAIEGGDIQKAEVDHADHGDNVLSLPEEIGDTDDVSQEDVAMDTAISTEAVIIDNSSSVKEKESVDENEESLKDEAIAVSKITDEVLIDNSAVTDKDSVDKNEKSIKDESIDLIANSVDKDVEYIDKNEERIMDISIAVSEIHTTDVEVIEGSDGPEISAVTNIQKGSAVFASASTSDNVALDIVEPAETALDNVTIGSPQDGTVAVPDEAQTWKAEPLVEDVELVAVNEELAVESSSTGAEPHPEATESDLPSVVPDESIPESEVIELVTSETRV